MSNYDVIILGGGPGGYTAALRAALRGAKVCCIEADKLGGTCLNVGCIPTKAMLHASEFYHNISLASQFGFSGAGAAVDGRAYMARVTKVVAGLRKGVEGLMKARKVDVIGGRGRLVAADTISVQTDAGTEQVRAGAIIIATGSVPARPDFLPWDSRRIMTTNEATTAESLPESVVIVGGGVIGCELATVYAELGIPTTVVEMLDRLVAGLDAEASKIIARSLKKRGATVLTGCRIVGVTASDSGVSVELEDGKTIESADAIAAVGRRPNTNDIGAEEVGVELDGGVIRVDDRCRTNVEGIFAVGDAAETRHYAHLAARMGVIAADNATGHDARDDRTVIPTGVYTHPEVAAVGLTEEQARDSGGEIRVASFSLRASGMAHAYGEVDGQVKIIAEAKTGKVLGSLVIGPHATDVIQEIALAMRCDLTVEDISETIHAHPTFAEAIAETAEAWLGLPIHTLG
ncbi:MAG: dihydrolipoyl dehydrogenase [Phycisphaerae bacterium]|nr:dihydrolipoyl dehydrogenase [Phycisphaerae bacterium]